MFDMEKLKSLVDDMQKNMQDQQEKIKNEVFTETSGGGLVKVSMNGIGELIDLSIDDSLLEDKESLQILLLAALNELYKKVEDNRKNTALDAFGGMKNFGLFG